MRHDLIGKAVKCSYRHGRNLIGTVLEPLQHSAPNSHDGYRDYDTESGLCHKLGKTPVWYDTLNKVVYESDKSLSQVELTPVEFSIGQGNNPMAYILSNGNGSNLVTKHGDRVEIVLMIDDIKNTWLELWLGIDSPIEIYAMSELAELCKRLNFLRVHAYQICT